MIKELIAMYEAGSITGYQLMMDCLQRLDPEHPEVVLSELPAEVLDEMLAYARRYDPRRPRSATFPPPAEDQVRSAERWICAHHAGSSNPVGR
jgi:hypothetical protein